MIINNSKDSSTTTKNTNNRLLELDALRGIAALSVVLFHFTMGREESKWGFKLGTTGVDLFFIISGFVIFMSLNRVSKSKDFIINRVSRLYPTYWCAVTFTFLLIICKTLLLKLDFHPINEFLNYAGNLTMFQYYLGIPDLDGPYWTMIIEMLFYILILLLYQFNLLKLLNILGLITSISIVILTSFWGNHNIVKAILNWIPLLPYIPLFLAGTVFYKIYINNQQKISNYAIILLCLIAQFLLFEHSGRSHHFINHQEYAIMICIYFTLFILFVNHKLNFIVSKLTLFLGKISFALYLTHQYISLQFLLPILVNKLHLNFWIAALFITLPISILIATLITKYVDIPLSKKMKEKLKSYS